MKTFLAGLSFFFRMTITLVGLTALVITVAAGALAFIGIAVPILAAIAIYLLLMGYLEALPLVLSGGRKSVSDTFREALDRHTGDIPSALHAVDERVKHMFPNQSGFKRRG